MDYFPYLILVLTFLAALLLVEGLFVTWRSWFASERRRLSPRLRAVSGTASPTGTLSLLKSRPLAKIPGVERLLEHLPRAHELDRLILQAGFEFNLAQLTGWSLGLGFGAALAHLVLGAPGRWALLAFLAGVGIPSVYLLNRRRSRLLEIEEQLPAALDLISRAMQAGHAFPSALKMAGEEMPQPIGHEFQIAFDEINFGLDQPTALGHMAQRIPLPDLQHFVLSVLIQRDTGGNLAALLASIAALMRARAKFRRSIRIMTAEGRLSALILIVLPFALGMLLHLVNPGFIDVLFTDPLGVRLVFVVLLLMGIGVFWMSRIVKIRT
jgi:tight adherence protein B